MDDHLGHAGPAVSRESPMNADDSAKLRDLLANNRTLLAYIRTALAFAGLGFAVAKFGLNPKMMRVSGYLGTFMVLVGLLVTIIGFAQHRAMLHKIPLTIPELKRLLAALTTRPLPRWLVIHRDA